jgi:hypothetical protein
LRTLTTYLNYNNLQSAEVKYSIARAVDNIMSMHRNDKGIIHTTSYSQGHPNYTTINSNRTAELEGFPAYSLEFSDINTDDNSTYKDLELGTIIFGDKVLYVYYRADTPSFSTFLPTALEMIGSLRINESVITEPVPSSSPSRSIIASTAAPHAVRYTIFGGSIHIDAGHDSRYKFYIPANATDVTLSGSLSVTGGIIQQIKVDVYDDTNCTSDEYFSQCGQNYIDHYYSDSSSFSTRLASGRHYVLILDNDALVSSEDKTVDGSITLSYTS